MIPFGSVGGCQNTVMEEAVTFAMVTFCGGSNGPAGTEIQNFKKIKIKRPKESQRWLNIHTTPVCAVVKLI